MKANTFRHRSLFRLPKRGNDFPSEALSWHEEPYNEYNNPKILTGTCIRFSQKKLTRFGQGLFGVFRVAPSACHIYQGFSSSTTISQRGTICTTITFVSPWFRLLYFSSHRSFGVFQFIGIDQYPYSLIISKEILSTVKWSVWKKKLVFF